MTDRIPGPEEAPAPPTSTGWSSEDDGQDEELAPPFVPGGTEPEPAAREAAEPADVDAQAEPLAAPFEPAAAPEEAGDQAEDEESFPFETGWTEGAAADESEEDEFPFDAFDIEGESGEDEAGPDTPQDPEARVTREMAAAREAASRLEEMARRLRDQGPEAARAEIDSSDRFTSLLAGLLAGYLAGRE